MGSSRWRTASWVLLTVVGALTLLVSLVSAFLAYLGEYPIGGMPVAEVAAGRDGLLTALRGMRGTAAAFGAAFSVMLLGTVLGPYRAGDRRAWWTISWASRSDRGARRRPTRSAGSSCSACCSTWAG